MYFVFAGWATLFISVSSALESQEAQRRAAVLQAEGRIAELRALRYQLNPHFLFNALNAVSALVLRGDADGAESTIQALSLFLRSALVAEPIEDATLGEELDLQRLYLGIEQVRFGDRLRVVVCVPPELRQAMLPPLLLQPLVENVIRHAVAPGSAPVTMTIGASAEANRLHIQVEDDGRGGPTPAGTGIGLRNVEARLLARFGSAACCERGARAGGGFRVDLMLPLRLRREPA
jgi:two-component system LytT family sensor kinase